MTTPAHSHPTPYKHSHCTLQTNIVNDMTGLVPMPLLLLGMGSALVLVAPVALVIALLLILQPGNPEFRDHAALLSKQPYIVF